MALDMTYQALPEECTLLKRSLLDTEFGEFLSFLPGLYQRGAAAWREGKRSEFWQQASELAKQHPGLEKRNCYVGRRWDQLHYLLSANRRGKPGREHDEILDKAILGNKLEKIRSTQDIPVGYVSASEVREIVPVLDSIAPADLELYYMPEEMMHHDVYKIRAQEPEENWAWIIQTFEAFRSFYRQTAACQEGAIAILD